MLASNLWRRSGGRAGFWNLLTLALALVFATPACAGGPRFVSGSGWGVYPGYVVSWNPGVLSYYTDPGPLSPAVNHAQADAMVAAAAAAWNVPTSSLTLSQGGTLAEDVSTANVTVSGSSVVFPADAQVSNEAAVPIAVIYDQDGGLIDLLLGTGASEPDGCRQNAVVGDVDDINRSTGRIAHATLILNGRCVGSTHEQLTEMQYHLMRAFGRVLGLTWAQVNDNVFTAQTTITPHQMANWPVMHPIDVICGNYAYQCMSDPFTLRTDDLSALGGLYPVGMANPPAGKQPTSADALWVYGILYFPTGQGMNMTNITTRRQVGDLTEDWEMTSEVSGFLYQQARTNPVTGVQILDAGTFDPFWEGAVNMRRIPLNGLSNVFMTSQPINPLYTGELAVATYVRPIVQPSGSPQTMVDWSAVPAGDLLVGFTTVAGDAASNCAPGNDGTESAPAALDESGWQNGLQCGWQHNSWWTASIAAGHTWTLETTATDEAGSSTMAKAQPVMAVWHASDPAGTAPTVASAPVAFNSFAPGVTSISGHATATAQSLRILVGDQFGEGRPDFTYTTRLLYAATVTPASVGSAGGQITVKGMGFRRGNQVTVNGVAATVLSWTSTQIVAIAPSAGLASATLGVPVTVAVSDPTTGGSTAIPSAMKYMQLPNGIQQVSAPDTLTTGMQAQTPFAVRVLTSDGLVPVAGARVQFSVGAGSAQLGACNGATSCVAVTDSTGQVQTTVTGKTVGNVLLVATEMSGGASVQANVADSDPVRNVALSSTAVYLAAGSGGSWTVKLGTLWGITAATGIPVTWTTSQGLSLGAADSVSGADGTAQVHVSANVVSSGYVGTLTACAWTTVCATWTLHGVDASQWQVNAGAGTGQSVAATGALTAASAVVTDLSGHPLEGAPVDIHQRVLAWGTDCSGNDRCAAAPVLKSSETTAVSDPAGTVSVMPLEVPAVPQVVQVAVSTGSQGFLTFTLVKKP